MKKYIILSVNDNPDYLYYTPLTCWAWRKFGWEPIVFNSLDQLRNGIFPLVANNSKGAHFAPFENRLEGYRSDTITQISRLYGACVADEPDAMLMTGDIDMIPLSDYWKPEFDKITVYGSDLTGHKQYPICYIAMNSAKWVEVMKLTNFDYDAHIKRDLDSLPQAKDPDFYKYWFSDQDLITTRLNEYGKDKLTFIDRGQGSHGFARGRVDRGNGGAGWVLNQPELIDAHMLIQTHHSEEKIRKLMDLLHHVWPKENWLWFLEYTKEFKKLAV
jgi:hypothetical protein